MKKMMKKITTIALGVMLCMTSMLVAPRQADTVHAANGTSDICYATDGTFVVKVNVNDAAKEIGASMVWVKYDNTDLEYISYETGSLMEDHIVQINDDEVRCISTVADTAENMNAEGTIISLKFKVKNYDADNTSESYAFSITKKEFCDVNSQDVDIDDVSVNVVGHKEEAVAAEGATCQKEGHEAGTKCSECQKILSGHSPIPIDEHKFTEYTSNDDATYENDGTETASCDYGCGTKDTRPDVGSQLVKDDDTDDNEDETDQEGTDKEDTNQEDDSKESTEKEENDRTEDKGEDSLLTGDNVNILLYVLLAGIALGVCVLLFARAKNNIE